MYLSYYLYYLHKTCVPHNVIEKYIIKTCNYKKLQSRLMTYIVDAIHKKYHDLSNKRDNCNLEK